jgi:hypothetical protein
MQMEQRSMAPVAAEPPPVMPGMSSREVQVRAEFALVKK